MPGGQQQDLLRPPSPGVTRSDGNSSLQVQDTSSNRARSTDRSPGRPAVEPSSSSHHRPHITTSDQLLQSKRSMSQDLAGLIDETGPASDDLDVSRRGLKRSRDEFPQDEPAPKRDRLQIELEEMEEMHRRESSGDDEGTSPAIPVDSQPSHDDTVPPRQPLPIRRSSRTRAARGVNQSSESSRSNHSSRTDKQRYSRDGTA